MAAAALKEIIELHQFFQDWFNGAMENNEAQFGRFDNVIADTFTIIPPHGRLMPRNILSTGLRQSYGQWREKGGGQIEVRNFQFHWQQGEIMLATYEEWQKIGEAESSRLSSVIFRRQVGLPNGLVWLHVHETWIPAPS